MQSVPFEDLTRERLAERPRLAAGMLGLLEAPGDWVRRRVERIDYASLEEVDVAATLDIHLPLPVQDAVSVDGGRLLLIPLGYGIKGHKLTRFSLSIDGERPASLLTLSENRVLSGAVLQALVERCGGPPDTREAAETLCGPGLSSDEATRLRRIVLDAVRPPAVATPEGASLIRWLNFLARRYVLYAALRRDLEQPGEQWHVRTGQTLPVNRPSGGGPRSRDATLGELRVTLPVFDLGFASSYHLDLGVPPELRIARATLRGPASETLDTDQDQDRATLETRAQPPYAGQAEVELVVRPEQRAFTREAWPVSAFVALATFSALVPVAYDEPAPVGLVALLLAPLAASVALSFRSFADDLTRVLVGRQQRYLRVQVVCLVIAIAMMLLRPLLPGWDWVVQQVGAWAVTPLAVLVAAAVTAPLAGALLTALAQRNAYRSSPKEPIS